MSQADITPTLKVEVPASKLVQFTADESAILHACCTLVDLSPRAIKRLVNVSKLLKLVWARSDRMDPTLATTGAMSLLLALSARYGDVMRGVLVDLRRRADERPTQTLAAAMADYALPDHEWYLKRDHDMWAADVARCSQLAVGLTGNPAFRLGVAPLADVVHALDVVATFSFLGEIGYEPDVHSGHLDHVAPKVVKNGKNA